MRARYAVRSTAMRGRLLRDDSRRGVRVDDARLEPPALWCPDDDVFVEAGEGDRGRTDADVEQDQVRRPARAGVRCGKRQIGIPVAPHRTVALLAPVLDELHE